MATQSWQDVRIVLPTGWRLSARAHAVPRRTLRGPVIKPVKNMGTFLAT